MVKTLLHHHVKRTTDRRVHADRPGGSAERTEARLCERRRQATVEATMLRDPDYDPPVMRDCFGGAPGARPSVFWAVRGLIFAFLDSFWNALGLS